VGSTDVWSSLRSRLCPAIDSLLDWQLSTLLQDLLDRLDLHRETPITTSIALTVLSLSEHYFTRAPSDSTASLVLKVWGHCLGRHALVSAPFVLASIFAILDHNVTDVKSLNSTSPFLHSHLTFETCYKVCSFASHTNLLTLPLLDRLSQPAAPPSGSSRACRPLGSVRRAVP
jgi:hypothetical protein